MASASIQFQAPSFKLSAPSASASVGGPLGFGLGGSANANAAAPPLPPPLPPPRLPPPPPAQNGHEDDQVSESGSEPEDYHTGEVGGGFRVNPGFPSLNGPNARAEVEIEHSLSGSAREDLTSSQNLRNERMVPKVTSSVVSPRITRLPARNSSINAGTGAGPFQLSIGPEHQSTGSTPRSVTPHAQLDTSGSVAIGSPTLPGESMGAEATFTSPGLIGQMPLPPRYSGTEFVASSQPSHDDLQPPNEPPPPVRPPLSKKEQKKFEKEEKKRKKEEEKRKKQAEKAIKKSGGLQRASSDMQLSAAERAQVGVGGGAQVSVGGGGMRRSASTQSLGQRFFSSIRASFRKIKDKFSGKGKPVPLSAPQLLPRDQPRPSIAVNTKEATKALTRKAIVVLLDGDEVQFEIEKKSTGRQLFDKLCDYINLVEKDFFGLTFVHGVENVWFWLDLRKPIYKQLRHKEEWLFRFQVKFYPPDPIEVLREEISRYQFTLQLRQDTYYNKLPSNDETIALLGAYMVQSEVGDYEGRDDEDPDPQDPDADRRTQDENENAEGQERQPRHHPLDIEYLRKFPFVKTQTDEILEMIAKEHKKLKGVSPAEADTEYIKSARRLELYGLDLQPVKDSARTSDLKLGVFFAGVIIYKETRRLEFYSWPNIIKLSYRKNDFCIRLKNLRFPSSHIDVSYALPNHRLAKRLWRIAIENHAFFQTKTPKSDKAHRGSVLGIGKSEFNKSESGTLWSAQQHSVAREQQPAFLRLASKRLSQSTSALEHSGHRRHEGPIEGDQHDSSSDEEDVPIPGPEVLKQEDLILPPPRIGTLRSSQSLEHLNQQAPAPKKPGFFARIGSIRSNKSESDNKKSRPTEMEVKREAAGMSMAMPDNSALGQITDDHLIDDEEHEVPLEETAQPRFLEVEVEGELPRPLVEPNPDQPDAGIHYVTVPDGDYHTIAEAHAEPPPVSEPAGPILYFNMAPPPPPPHPPKPEEREEGEEEEEEEEDEDEDQSEARFVEEGENVEVIEENPEFDAEAQAASVEAVAEALDIGEHLSAPPPPPPPRGSRGPPVHIPHEEDDV